MRGAGSPCGSAHKLPNPFGLLFDETNERTNKLRRKSAFPHENSLRSERSERAKNFVNSCAEQGLPAAAHSIELLRGAGSPCGSALKLPHTCGLLSDGTNKRTSGLRRKSTFPHGDCFRSRRRASNRVNFSSRRFLTTRAARRLRQAASKQEIA